MRQISLATALLAALALAIPATARAAGDETQDGRIRIQGGYVSGREYLDMDGLTKKAYVSGLIEGMLLAPAFGAPEQDMEWFYTCTNEIGLKDLRKVLYEYIKDDHDLWDNRNPAKAFRAIYQACLAHAQPSGEKDGDAGAGEKKADE